MKKLSFAGSACFLSMLACLQLAVPLPLLAQVSSPVTPPVHTQNLSHPGQLNLNLSSTQQTASASHLLHNTGTVNINVGGSSMAVTPTTLLTTAERMAVMEVLRSGVQTLQLGALGNAVGGSFTLSAGMAQHISSLVIPQGVTAILNTGKTGTIDLSGNLIDAGSLYAVSRNSSLASVTLDASNIIVGAGGLLTTVIPAAGLPGVSGAVSNLSLTLNAINNISNAGTISSAGNLSLNAGGSIANANALANASAVSEPGSAGEPPALIAANSISLSSATGTFVNTGLINSQQGNINFASPANMVVNNTGGTIQALNGAINLRDPSFTADANTTLTGGNWLSQQLNVYSGSGRADLDVGNISGTLNVYAGSLGLQANAPNLNVGTLDITGDPFLYDTGNVDISSLAPVNGASYVIVAGGNITDNDSTGIDTSSSGGNGGNVVLVAGATATTTSDGNNTIVNGATSSGGYIQISSSSSTSTINTQSTATNGSGGDVSLVAFAGSGTNAGTINISNTGSGNAIQTNGNGTGSNGNVTIVAGGTSSGSFQSGFTVQVGNIVTGTSSSGGSGGGGQITIQTSTPVTSPTVISGSNSNQNGTGQILYGTFANGTGVDGAISTGNLSTAGAGVNLIAGSNETNSTTDAIQTGNITTTPASGAGGSVSLLTNQVGITGTIISVGNVDTSSSSGSAGGSFMLGALGAASLADVTTGGGSVLVYAGGVLGTGNITVTGTIDTSSTSGNGGNVILVSFGDTGTINNGSSGGFNITTASSASGGNAGSIAISSNDGVITLGTLTTTATGASNTGGSGGDILLTSSSSAAQSINVTTIDTSTSGTNSNVGQIYAVSETATSQIVFTNTPTQEQNGTQIAEPVTAAIPQTSITYSGSPYGIVFVPSSSASTPGSITGFSAGGFSGISDGSGSESVDIQLSVNNGGNTVTDTALLLPLISNGFAQLTNHSSILEIPTTSNAGIPNVALVWNSEVNLSGTTITTNGQGAFPLAAIGTYYGAGGTIAGIYISNSASSQDINLGLISTSGTAYIYTNGNLAVLAPEMVYGSYELDNTLASGKNITFSADVFTQGLTAYSEGGNISQTGGLLTTNTLTLSAISGSVSLTSTSAPFIALPFGTVNGVTITDSQSVSVSNTGSLGAITITETGPSALISVGTAGLSPTATAVLQAQAGSNASIDIEGNLSSSAATTLTADGAGSILNGLLGLGTGSISAGSHAISLTAGSTGGIGTSSSRVVVSTTGTLNLSAPSTTNGNVYLEQKQTSFTVGTWNIGNLLSMQIDGSFNLSLIGTPSIPNIALSTKPSSGYSITINEDFSTSASLSLTANGSIIQQSGGPFVLTSPNITLVATTGSVGTGTGSTSAIEFAGTGSVTLFASAPAGSVYMEDDAGDSIVLANTTITPLSAGVLFNLNLTTGGNISAATPGSTAISSPSISLSTGPGNITADGTITGGPLLVNSNSNPSGLSLFASTGMPFGEPAVINLQDNAQEPVTLMNSNGPLGVRSSTGTFSLQTNGNILAQSTNSDAIFAFNLSLIAIGGNITANGTATGGALQISGQAAGTLNLFVNSTQVGSAGGTVNLTDNVLENIIFANGSSSATPSNAAVSFTVTDAPGVTTFASIYAQTPSFTAITSPSISLTTTQGDIGGNSTATTPLLVNSNGHTGGLSLYASAISGGAGVVNISDNATETVTLANGTSGSPTPSNSDQTFTLAANGNIVAATPGSTAITAPNVNLTATNGSIGTSSVSQLLLNNGGGGLSLFASATGTGSSGSAWITDNSSSTEVLTLANTGAQALTAAVSFSVTNNNGSIVAATPASTAITSPAVSLSATGNIGSATNSAVIVSSGTSNPVQLTASSSGGSVWVQSAGSATLEGANTAGSNQTFSLTTTPDPTSGNGAILLDTGATVAVAGSSGTISLQSSENSGLSGTGGISQQTSSDVTLKAAAVNLNDANSSGTPGAGNGDIVVQGTNDGSTSAVAFTANTTGNVTLTAVGNAQLAGANTAGSNNTFSLTTTPDVTSGNGAIQLNTGATVTVAGTSGTISLQSSENAGLSGTGGISQQTSSDVTLKAATVNLNDANSSATPGAGNGDIVVQGTNDGSTSAVAFTANTTGNVTLTAVGNAQLAGANTAGSNNTFSLTTTPDATSGNGAIQLNTGATVTVAGTSGTISLQSSENSGLSGTGGISQQTSSDATLKAAIVNLNDANSSGTPGAGNGDIVVQGTNDGSTSTVAFTANTTGNVTLTAVGAAILGASSAGNGNTFSLSASSGSNGSIDIQGNVVAGTGTIGTIALSADGSGSITESTGMGTLTATTVELNAGSTGSIGSTSYSIQTSSTTLELSAPNGSAYIASTNNSVAFSNTDIANTLQLTVPGTVGVSIFSGLTIPNLALITTTGAINVDTSLSTTNSIALTAQTNIVEAGGSLTSPTVSLTASTGNIGASGSGNSVVFNATNVNLTATNSTNGNVYVQSPNTTFTFGAINIYNLLQLTITSGAVDTSILSPVSGTVPNLGLVTTTGDITSNAAISASNSITLTSSGNILQATNGLLSSLAINLTAQAGSIGTSGTALAVSSSNPGTAQATVSASATASSDGQGNVYLTDADHDTGIGSNPALLLGTSSANGEAGDATGGIFYVTTTNGSVGTQGVVTATTSITIQSAGSILNTSSGSSGFASPTISLTASNGNVGGNFMATPIFVSSGTVGVPLNLTVSATAVSTAGLGNVNIADDDSDPTGGQAVILHASSANGLNGDTTGGEFCLCATSGSINIAGTVSATTELDLGAHLNIVQGSGGLLSSPKMELSSDIGNIGGPGSQAIQVTGGGAQLTLDLVNTYGNEPGTGNIYITDGDSDISGQPALLLNIVTAGGSLTPADPTNGILVIAATAGSIGIEYAVNAISSLTLSAYNNIVQLPGGSLLSPSVNLTATTGSIGASGLGNAVAFGNDGNGVSFYATAGANVYATDTSSELVTLANTAITPLSAGSFFTLTAQSIGASAAAAADTAITSPSITLLGVNNITADGTSTGGALLVSSGGTSGLSLFAQVTSSGSGIGYVNLQDPNSETVTLVNNLNSNSPLSAPMSFALSASGSIVAANVNTTAILSASVLLVATGGNIGTSVNPLLVNNAGGGLSLFASATGTGSNGSLWITDNSSTAETLTLNNATTALSAGVLVSLTNSNGSIVAATPGGTAITSSNISLTASGGNISGDGTAGTPLLANSGGTGGLSLFASATNGGSGAVNIKDANAESVTLANGSNASSADGSFTLNSGGGIVAFTPANLAISSPAISLTAAGNIGSSSSSTVIITNGTSPGELTASSTGGSVWITGPGSVTLEGANGAQPGGVFFLSTTPDSNGNGAILIDTGATVTVNNNGTSPGTIFLQSSSGASTSGSGSITQNGGASTTTLMAAVVQLDASTNVHGTGSSAITVSTGVGSTGASAVSLSANSAGGTVTVTNNSGNVVLSGSNSAGDGQTYEVDNLATNGSIDIQGNVIANSGTISEITLIASGSGSITESTDNGLLTASTVNLNAGANGGIGSSTYSVQFNATTLDLSAPNLTSGNVYVQSTTSSFGFGPVDIGNLLYLTMPSAANVSILSPFFEGQSEAIPNLGLITQSGNINVDVGALVGESLLLNAAGSIALGGPGSSLFTPNLTLIAGGNIGASGGGNAIYFGNGTGVNLSVTASGSVYLEDGLGETVTLANGSNPLTAGTLFDLTVTGNIVAQTAGNTAIVSPSVLFVVTSGSIGTSAMSPLLVNNGGNGLSLFASASGTASNGHVWITDNWTTGSGETLTLNNTSAPLSAGVLFSVANNNGSIVAATTGSTAVTAPSVSLTATNGSIGTSISVPLLVNNGGNGLSLFASATGTASGQGNLWISDNYTGGSGETLTLNNASSALNAAVLLSITNEDGSIVASNTSSTAAVAPSMVLTATNGDIGSSGSVPLSIASGSTAGTLSLIAQASGSAGNVWLTDTLSTSGTGDVVSFNNGVGGAASSGSTSFSLVTAGNIAAAASSVAVTSPYITLETTNGSIYQIGTTALSIGSGTSSGTVNLVAQASGSVLLTDTTNDSVSFYNSGSGSAASSAGTLFQLNAVGDIIASTTANTAVASPAITVVSSNGVIEASGGTTPLSITSGGGGTVNLIAQAPMGSVWLTDAVSGDNVNFNNGMTGAASSAGTGGFFTLSTNGNITASAATTAITSPTITLTATNGDIGTSGTSQVLVNNGGGGVSLFASATGTGTGQGSLWIADNWTTGSGETLTLNNAAGALSAAVLFSVANNNGSIVAFTPGSTAITAPSVSLVATTGDIGTAGNSRVLMNDGGSDLSLFASATGTGSGQGSLWITDNSSTAETLTLNNSSAASSAAVLFSLTNSNGSIVASTPGNAAITGPTVRLVATTGDIGTSGTSQVLVNNGGGGLSLFAQATGTSTGQGSLWVTDDSSTAETLTLNNSSTAVSAGVLFSVTNSNGSIVAFTPGNTAITAPSVSLVATTGDIGTSGTSQVLVNDGGSGLSLFASATGTSSGQGSLWITDNWTTTSETLTLNNNTSALSAAVLFNATNSNGSIVAATPASTAITAPTVSLTATNGDIGTAGNSGVLMNNGGSGLSLFASATGTSSGQGSLWVTDNWTTTSETLTLNNNTSALSAAVLFNVTNSNGSIVAATPGSTAVIAPSVSLTATNGDIGSSSTSQVLVDNAGNGLLLFASATGTSSGQGSLWIEDDYFAGSGEVLTLNNASAALNAAVSFSVTNSLGNIVAALPSNTAVVAPSISLSTSFANIGTSSTSQILINNGGNGVSLFVSAGGDAVGLGSVWITDNYTAGSGETLTLNNTNGTPSAGSSINITNEDGSILAANPTSMAATAPMISLKAIGGNIEADGSGDPLIVADNSESGNLNLFASATSVNSAGGSVSINDTNNESVTLLNSSTTLSATVSFALQSGGSILAQAPGSTAVGSPSISLTAVGNITADGTSTGTALLVNSGGTSGLTLLAGASESHHTGGVVNLKDANIESVTLNSTSGISYAEVSFTLVANGNILASMPVNPVVQAASLSLTAIGGNISSDGTSSPGSPLSVEGNGSGLSLFASATKVGSNGGTVNLVDELGEDITLSNASGPSNAAVSFFLANASGSILAGTPGNTAASAPSMNLFVQGGNIGSSAQPLIVSSGNSGTTQLSLSVNTTATASGNGNAYLKDTDSDVGSTPALLLVASYVAGLSNDTTTGNLVVTTSVGSIGVSGAVIATSGLTISANNSIVYSGGTLESLTMGLSAVTGNIGTSGSPIAISSGNSGTSQLTLTASATNTAASSGNIYVTDGDSNLGTGLNQQALVINSLTAGSGSGTPPSTNGNISVTTTVGGMTVSSTGTGISATNAITLQASATSGGSSINLNSNVNSTTGTILIENDDATVSDNATINVAAGVTVASGQAAVTVTMGAFTSPVTGTPPADVTVIGNVAFGANSITGPGAGNNATVAGTAAQLAFQTSAASQITLANGSVVRAGPAGANILSLDLTNSTATSAIIADQANPNSGVTGTLVVNGSGVATGGNIIFSTNASLFNVSAEDIPAGVTVDFKGFQSGNLININLSNTSTTKQVFISGTEAFVAGTSASNGVINIATSLGSSQMQPVLSIASTGLLTTDGSMTVNVAGGITNAGQITSTGAGNITLNATGAYGNIAIGNNVTTSGSGVVSITASQALTRTAGTVTGGTVNLGGSAAIGTSAANIMTVANILSTATAGSAYVTNTGSSALSIAASTANLFQLTSASNITVTGAITAPTVTLQGSGTNMAIAIGANIGSGSGVVQLLAKGTGAITETGSGGTVDGTAITLSSGSGNIGTAQSTGNTILTDADTLTVSTTSTLGAFISNASPVTVNASSTGAAFNLLANGAITVAQAVTASSVTLSTTPAPNAFVTLNATVTASGSNGVTINTNGGSVTETSTVSITTPSLTINTSSSSGGGGMIGTSSTAQLLTNAGTISATTNAAAGSGTTGSGAGYVFIKDTNTSSVSLSVSAQGGSASGSGAAGGNGGTVVATLSATSAVSLNISTPGGAANVGPNAVGGNGGGVTVNLSAPVSGSINTAGGDAGFEGSTSGNTSGNGGLITVNSTGTLTVGSSGLTLNGSAGNSRGVNGTVGTDGNALLTTTAAAGSVSLLGNVTFITQDHYPTVGPATLTLQATGTGTITQSSGVVIDSPSLTLSSDSGGIGTSTQPIALVSSNANSNNEAAVLSANTTGSVYLLAGSSAVPTPVALNQSRGNIFQLIDVSQDNTNTNPITPAITLAQNLTATTVILQASNSSAGSIKLLGNIAGASGNATSVTLAAGGAGVIFVFPGDSISTSSLYLSSGSGCIGCSLAGQTIPIAANASTLSANTTGAVSISDSNTGSTTILMPSTGSSFTLALTGTSSALDVNGALRAPTVSLTTVNGAIQINAAVTATTLASLTTSVGNIAAAGTLLYSPSVSLTTGSGNVGTSSTAFAFESSQSSPSTPVTLTAGSTSGNMYLNSNSPVGFSASPTLSGSGTFALTANGSIALAAYSLTTGSVSLTANGTGSSITQTTSGGAASITAGTIVLTANSGGIGSSGTPLGIATASSGTTQLTASTTGSVYITANSNVNFVGTSSAAGSNGFNLTTNNYSVTQSSGASINTPALDIIASAGPSGNIGVSGMPLVTNAGSLNLNTGGIDTNPAGNIFLTDTNTSGLSGSISAVGGTPISLGDGGNGGSVTLLVSAPMNGLTINTSGGPAAGFPAGSAGTVQISGASSLTVGSSGLTITSSGGVGSPNGASANATLSTSGAISLTGNITFTATGAGSNNLLTLQSTGSGNITQTSGKTITTGGGNLALASVNGVIGTSLAPITSDAANLKANTAGAVNLSDTNSSGVTLGASTGSVFNLTTANNLTVNGAVTSNGNMNLIQTGGTALTIVANLQANGGSMVIQNQNTSGSIVIGDGSTPVKLATNVTSATKGTSGQIQIYLGTAAPQAVGTETSPFNNISFTTVTAPGTVYFGSTPGQVQGGTSGSGAMAQINLIKQNVFFNVPASTTGTITINKGVTIQADPQTGPVGVSSQINSFTGSETSGSPAPGTGSGSAATGTVSSSGISGALLGSSSMSVNSVTNSASSITGGSTSGAANSTNFNAVQAQNGASQTAVAARRDEPAELSLAPATENGPSAEDEVVIYTGMADQLSQPTNTGRISPRYENEVSEYTPISYLAPSTPELNAVPATTIQSQPNHPTLDGGTVNLNRGSVLFAPEKDLLVKTPHCTINVAARCVVLVSVTGSTVSVYDMYDVHSGDVKVTAHSGIMTLAPGKHVSLSNAAGSFASINAMHRVGYRNLKLSDSSDGLKQFTGDFSISSAITGSPRIREMLHSSDPTQVAIAKRMIKTAAIIAQTKRLAAPYSRVSDR